MLKGILKCRSWIIMLLLAALCLSSSAAQLHGDGDWRGGAFDSENVRLTFLPSSTFSIALSSEERTRLSGPDFLLSVLHGRGQTGFASETYPFYLDETAECAKNTDILVIFVRAPPCLFS